MPSRQSTPRHQRLANTHPAPPLLRFLLLLSRRWFILVNRWAIFFVRRTSSQAEWSSVYMGGIPSGPIHHQMAYLSIIPVQLALNSFGFQTCMRDFVWWVV